MNKRSIASLLRAGANRIESGGLARGSYKKGNSYCALGALGYGEPKLFGPHTSAAAYALRKFVGKGYIPAWSDTSHKNTVISAMRQTARALEHGFDISGYPA